MEKILEIIDNTKIMGLCIAGLALIVFICVLIDADWVLHGKIRVLVDMFGRKVARIFMGILSVIIIVMGFHYSKEINQAYFVGKTFESISRYGDGFKYILQNKEGEKITAIRTLKFYPNGKFTFSQIPKSKISPYDAFTFIDGCSEISFTGEYSISSGSNKFFEKKVYYINISDNSGIYKGTLLLTKDRKLNLTKGNMGNGWFYLKK